MKKRQRTQKDELEKTNVRCKNFSFILKIPLAPLPLILVEQLLNKNCSTIPSLAYDIKIGGIILISVHTTWGKLLRISSNSTFKH